MVVFLASCKTVDTVDAESTNNKAEVLGWYHGSCGAFHKSITSATKIVLVDKEQRRVKANIKGQASEESCAALMEGRAEVNRAEGYHFHDISSEDKLLLAEELGVVVMLSSLNNSEDMDINSNKFKDFFDYCTTSEGVRFYVWDGEKGQKHPFWQSYYYLGYDIEADCDF